MSATQDLYSVEQVAAQLGLHVRTVRNYVRDGRLKGVRIGKQYRIAREDLEALTGHRPAAPVTRTDTRALEDAAARDAAIRRQEIERSGMLSTCAVKPVPGVTCARSAEPGGVGRCVLTPAGAPGR